MIVSVEGNTVKMFGTIWENDGPYVTSDLALFFKTSVKDVTIQLHTPGGSVIDANLIFNFLKASGKNITFEIVGLAASMGSILMLAGEKIKMASNAFIMIHAPSGYVRGNAKTLSNVATLLTDMQTNFLDAYSAKTKRTLEDLSSWMDGDNWFSAKNALKEGLIDEIIDATIDTSGLKAEGEYNLEALTPAFAAFDDSRSNTHETQPENQIKMKLNAKNITALCISDNASETDINAAVEALVGKNADLANEITAKDAEIKKMNDEATAKADDEAESAIALAQKEGRFEAKDASTFLALFKANAELAKATIAKLPKTEKLPGATQTGNGASSEDRSSWTAKDWMKKDMAGLTAMRSEDNEAYQAIFSKK